ncbi:MAG: DegT/DnrJ/EryC1/StrS family aminotransferase [Vicinamibacteria bacterium]|nr:DegT/DnrJ/EryC1/StrS family aminotransferase [Vicinamibacteria bacterium]
MLHPPHRLDVSLVQLARAAAFLGSRDAAAAAAALEALWDPAGRALACLSVRSGFDLLLGALRLPAGSEVLASALNIDDMGALVAAHGLRLVPLDVDRDTLVPPPEELRRALTPRARLLLLAQLFGGRHDLSELARVAHEHGLLVVEDAAQAFTGLPTENLPGVDVSLWSFGTLKTATALGGAVAWVADPALRARMRDRQASWPLQPRAAYATKLARTAGLVVAQRPRVYGALSALAGACGLSFDAAVRRLTRGFPGRDPARLLAALRQRPPAAMLRFLAHRLRRFDARRLQLRSAAGQRVREALGRRAIGPRMQRQTSWLVAARERVPDELRAPLRERGFEISDASNVVAFGGAEARRLIDGMVYVPAYPEIGDAELAGLCATLSSPRAEAALVPVPGSE